MWFPKIVKKEKYYSDKMNGEKILYNRETISVKDIIINTDITASLFEIEFPVGLWVYDYRLGEKFEVK